MINSQHQSSLRYKVKELVLGLKDVWAISSAVERLPYKQDVPGSNPGSPILIFYFQNLDMISCFLKNLSDGFFYLSNPNFIKLKLNIKNIDILFSKL